MKRNKRTKAVDIVGRWVRVDDRIIQYKNISKNVKCSKCVDGLDENCSVCHGGNIKRKPKWYQLKKMLEYWLVNY
jgi:hypothetical protein